MFQLEICFFLFFFLQNILILYLYYFFKSLTDLIELLFFSRNHAIKRDIGFFTYHKTGIGTTYLFIFCKTHC